MTRRYVGVFAIVLLGLGVFGVYSALAGGVADNKQAGGPAGGELTVFDLAARKNASGYTDLTANELAQIARTPGLTVVNVHIPFAGDIPDTDLSIPYNQITRQLDRLPSKDEPIVLYCRTGGMSTTAAHALVDLGYTQVMELNGGLGAWRASGREILR